MKRGAGDERDEQRNYTLRGAARRLGLGESTLRRKVLEGQISYLKIGGRTGRLLFSPRDLEEFEERHRHPARVEASEASGR